VKKNNNKEKGKETNEGHTNKKIKEEE